MGRHRCRNPRHSREPDKRPTVRQNLYRVLARLAIISKNQPTHTPVAQIGPDRGHAGAPLAPVDDRRHPGSPSRRRGRRGSFAFAGGATPAGRSVSRREASTGWDGNKRYHHQYGGLPPSGGGLRSAAAIQHTAAAACLATDASVVQLLAIAGPCKLAARPNLPSRQMVKGWWDGW